MSQHFEGPAPTCPRCGTEVLDIDVKCPTCGAALSSTGAMRMVGGTVLGQYEITEVLGQGGMSVVYKGKHNLTEQEVALKILPPELAAHSQVKSRFLEEAKALAQLDHRSIVHLYNFGEDNGCFVLAMQFVEGKTLERMIIEGERLDWRIACTLGLDTLHALEYAHERGIVHRDMKPSNILVRESDGSATVMDFGIAKMTTSSKLTATGQTMGTVRYMSPEQVRGHKVDPRTDLYSFSVMLYECLVGDTPFDGDTHFEIMTKHLNEAPDPFSAWGVEVPAALEAVVLKGLAKKTEDRPASAAEYIAVLEALLAGEEIPEFKPAPKRAERAEATTVAAARQVAPALDEQAASALGPTGPMPDAGRKPPSWLWLAMAAAVFGSGAFVAVMMLTRDEAVTEVPVDDAPPAPRSPWPEAHVIPDVEIIGDRRFEDDQIRVVTLSAVAPEDVRATVDAAYKAARSHLADAGVIGDAKRPALNVVVIPPGLFCDSRVYEEGAVPEHCKDTDHHYRPNEQTLYVPDYSIAEGGLSGPLGIVLCVHGTTDNTTALKCLDAVEELARPTGRKSGAPD